MAIMKTAAQRGATVVRQVLTFARGIEGERGEVQLKHIIREIEQLVGETFPKVHKYQVPDSQRLTAREGRPIPTAPSSHEPMR